MADKTRSRTARTAFDLAWGTRGGRRRGPRPSLVLDDIVAAAVAIADAEGIEALSMQRIASRVGVTPMALYRYVGSKDDLVALAVDAAGGEPPPGPSPGEGWRVATERWALAQLDGLERHRWIARVPISTAPLGPNQVVWMERCLECLEGTGLGSAERLGIMNVLAGYVLGHFRIYDDLGRAAAAAGMSREEAERIQAADGRGPHRPRSASHVWRPRSRASLWDPRPMHAPTSRSVCRSSSTASSG